MQFCMIMTLLVNDCSDVIMSRITNVSEVKYIHQQLIAGNIVSHYDIVIMQSGQKSEKRLLVASNFVKS